MNKMRLQIISPSKILYDGECTMLEYNTTEGYVGVLYGHVAMTQIIAPGKLTIYEEGVEKPKYIALISGIAKIMPDAVMLLAEIAEPKEEIDVNRAKAARDRAIKRIEEKKDNFDMERAKYALRKAKTRIEVAEIE